MTDAVPSRNHIPFIRMNMDDNDGHFFHAALFYTQKTDMAKVAL